MLGLFIKGVSLLLTNIVKKKKIIQTGIRTLASKLYFYSYVPSDNLGNHFDCPFLCYKIPIRKLQELKSELQSLE